MAIRHIVMFRFREGTEPEQVDALCDGLARLPGVIDEIDDYRFGPDAGINDTSWDFAIVADCASVDDYLTYRDHPEHRALIRNLVEPMVAERASVQLTTGP
ncbi:MAG: Stress responsive Barrel Domain protein [Acidimicrobiales bacterium]|nr:Stress responsive Barrel Domain protein [Acidimicrobiales bacterium]